MFPRREIHCQSEEYFRIQFSPRNKNSRTATKYCRRFDVKWLLQTRLLHNKSHPDQHYGAKQYMKLMAQRFQNNSIVIFLDDKAAIPIGHPSTPVSATKQQRKVLAAGVAANELTAARVDVIPMHLTPSVSIMLTPPNSDKFWYGGDLEVIQGNSVLWNRWRLRS